MHKRIIAHPLSPLVRGAAAITKEGGADAVGLYNSTTWPLRHLPDGRGRGAEGNVWGNPASDRRTATKTGTSVGTGTVGCVITTG